MPKPLFGYRTEKNKITVDESAARVVRAVLSAPKDTQVAAERVRELLGDDCTKDAVQSLISRIRRHARRYYTGKARADLRASGELALIGAHAKSGGIW